MGVFRCVPVGARLLKQHIVINLQVSLVALRLSLQTPHIHHGLRPGFTTQAPARQVKAGLSLGEKPLFLATTYSLWCYLA